MIFEDLIAAIQPELDESGVYGPSPATVLRELPGWSSMLALLLIARVDEEFGVQISAADFAGLRTLGDLHALVQAKSGR